MLAECLAGRTPNHFIVCASPAEATWLIKNRPVWAMGGDNGKIYVYWQPEVELMLTLCLGSLSRE